MDFVASIFDVLRCIARVNDEARLFHNPIIVVCTVIRGDNDTISPVEHPFSQIGRVQTGKLHFGNQGVVEKDFAAFGLQEAQNLEGWGLSQIIRVGFIGNAQDEDF